ncbi:ComF family protein [Paraglaciecola aestuariivivens]
MAFGLLQNCLICNQDSPATICQYCLYDLEFFDLDRHHYNLLLAPKIKAGLGKIDFTHLLALADYQWPLSRLLSSLKFSARIPHAKALAKLFFNHCLSHHPELPELIIPMPLHANRYLFRKYNQSIELAKHIAKFSQIPMHSLALQRIKATQAQTALSAVQRRQNLAQAFQVNALARPCLDQFSHVALFDDVITTGTTMNCAYQCLAKQYTHLRIDVWSICLTLVR